MDEESSAKASVGGKCLYKQTFQEQQQIRDSRNRYMFGTLDLCLCCRQFPFRTHEFYRRLKPAGCRSWLVETIPVNRTRCRPGIRGQLNHSSFRSSPNLSSERRTSGPSGLATILSHGSLGLADACTGSWSMSGHGLLGEYRRRGRQLWP
jgi:hypothetical protein